MTPHVWAYCHPPAISATTFPNPPPFPAKTPPAGPRLLARETARNPLEKTKHCLPTYLQPLPLSLLHQPPLQVYPSPPFHHWTYRQWYKARLLMSMAVACLSATLRHVTKPPFLNRYPARPTRGWSRDTCLLSSGCKCQCARNGSKHPVCHAGVRLVFIH